MTAATLTRTVLTEHQKAAWGMSAGSPDTCRCGAQTMYEPGPEDVLIRRDRAFAAHQADMLAAALPDSAAAARSIADTAAALLLTGGEGES